MIWNLPNADVEDGGSGANAGGPGRINWFVFIPSLSKIAFACVGKSFKWSICCKNSRKVATSTKYKKQKIGHGFNKCLEAL